MWDWNILGVDIDNQNYNINEIKEKAEKVKDDYIFKIE